jgi:hypothetical protein
MIGQLRLYKASFGHVSCSILVLASLRRPKLQDRASPQVGGTAPKHHRSQVQYPFASRLVTELQSAPRVRHEKNECCNAIVGR